MLASALPISVQSVLFAEVRKPSVPVAAFAAVRAAGRSGGMTGVRRFFSVVGCVGSNRVVRGIQQERVPRAAFRAWMWRSKSACSRTEGLYGQLRFDLRGGGWIGSKASPLRRESQSRSARVLSGARADRGAADFHFRSRPFSAVETDFGGLRRSRFAEVKRALCLWTDAPVRRGSQTGAAASG